ncbi:peptidase domain-containing ABC transporter [uncultured Selenomonas sp.]|uniref:peptidase domain-containing ABC transporter n=1 Tax=uncultured Selenomonas sp. TaxID=159275 RepID=UPI0025CCFFE9|nr:type I secretion system permease/ATPase [uncultured Selenomonas sp.]
MANIDSALACLVRVAAHFKIPADYSQLARAYIVEKTGVDTVGLLRAAGDLGLKSRKFEGISAEHVKKMPHPCVCRLKNGMYLLYLGVNKQGVPLIQDPSSGQQGFVKPDFFAREFSGEVVLFAKRFSIEKLKDKVEKFGFGWFLPVVAKYQKFLVQVLVVSLIMQGFGLLTPFFTQTIIDRVLTHHSVSTMNVMIAGMVLVGLFNQWMMALRTYLFIHTTNKIDVTLSSHLFRKVTELPVRYFDKWQVGDVVSRMGELETIRSFLTGSALTVVLDAVLAVVYLTVMFLYSPTLSYIVWATIPLYIILNAVIAPIYKKRINERFLLASEQQSFAIEAVTGVRTVKTMGVEQTFVDRYEQVLSRYLKSALSVLNIANFAGSIGTFLSLAFNLAILWIGAYQVMARHITVGELIAFQMLAGQVIAPILRLVNMWQYFQQIRVSMARLGDIMDEKSEPAFNPNRTTLPQLRGSIMFDKVNFRYKADGKNVLTDISVKIPAGAHVGIVGRSGSGKSTLTRLVQRLYVPESGRVLVDGVDIAQVETAWLRRQIGIVLQENFLFAGTIRENIAIAMPNIDEESVMRAAKLAGVDDFVKDMPQGYDTFVGERGSLLSGGQRQRVAIARALLLDPRILIFDEATSALDTESEQKILVNMKEISKGRTTITIAHRLSTVRDCDAILAMDHGRIVEAGSHAELMARKGYYYHLYMAQE